MPCTQYLHAFMHQGPNKLGCCSRAGQVLAATTVEYPDQGTGTHADATAHDHVAKGQQVGIRGTMQLGQQDGAQGHTTVLQCCGHAVSRAHGFLLHNQGHTRPYDTPKEAQGHPHDTVETSYDPALLALGIQEESRVASRKDPGREHDQHGSEAALVHKPADHRSHDCRDEVWQGGDEVGILLLKHEAVLQVRHARHLQERPHRNVHKEARHADEPVHAAEAQRVPDLDLVLCCDSVGEAAGEASGSIAALAQPVQPRGKQRCGK
mmetsp:Transcript_138418/g.336417  ORF Transcript_138418/g.336417 Transcript_138418/m.336417 type:complete len:265 (+) Transcript_138418:223-1017(+)